GVVILINHNIRSWLPRLLGERCPMYDVEHIYLFDKRTVTRLLQNNDFQALSVRNVSNRYALSYAVKMFPFPRFLKAFLLRLVERAGLASWPIRLPAGNMVTVGRKPLSAQGSRALVPCLREVECRT